MTIEDIELSVRARNLLMNWGGDISLENLHKTSVRDLMRIPNLGERTAHEIKSAVAAVLRGPEEGVLDERYASGRDELRWLRWCRVHPKLAATIVEGLTHISVTVKHTDLSVHTTKEF